MNFFEHQDRARRHTTRLVILFALAVVLIVLAVNLAVAGIFMATGAFRSANVVYDNYQYGMDNYRRSSRIQAEAAPNPWWQPQLYAYVTGGTLLVIFLGTAYKMVVLSAGGRAVAELFGAKLVNPNTDDADERKLLNVVEEMSIASGLPVPPVYVLRDESGINAFAAGYSTSDAVVAVTRGCMRLLSRDELQGVVAHEFSHILNGDMRLNLRLMGTLNGILVIGLIGYGILRSVSLRPVNDDDYGFRSSSRKKENGGIFAILAIGVALLVIGYAGVFFGRLIQAAVSRQREYLADASAVQFTRNPGGIVGALKKIGGMMYGSQVINAHAIEASHMFFGDVATHAFTNLMATHPPLTDRIRAIDPSFDGKFPHVAPPKEPAVGLRAQHAAMGIQPAIPLQPQSLAEHVGRPSPLHVAYAASVLGAMPTALDAAAREPFGARAIVFCLLLDKDEAMRRKQLAELQQQAEPQVYRETLQLAPAVKALAAESRLPLLQLLFPALRQLSAPQVQQFMKTVNALIEADQQISLFEYTLYKILSHHLASGLRPAKRTVAQYYGLAGIWDETVVLLAALAYADGKSPQAAAAAFASGVQSLKGAQPVAMPPQPGLAALDAALDRLALASPALKQRILEACAYCAAADQRVQLEEAELLRAIATSLDCPLPPFLASSQPGEEAKPFHLAAQP